MYAGKALEKAGKALEHPRTMASRAQLLYIRNELVWDESRQKKNDVMNRPVRRGLHPPCPQAPDVFGLNSLTQLGL